MLRPLEARWGKRQWLPCREIRVLDAGEYLVEVTLPLGATMMVRRTRRDLRERQKPRKERGPAVVNVPLFGEEVPE